MASCEKLIMKSLKSVVVGALAAVVVFGGIQVVAAVTTNKEIKVCANKQTGGMRYTTKSCNKKLETTIVFNSQGVSGVAGAKGETGTTGVKGDTGAAGTAGAKGEVGAAGGSGSTFISQSICGTDGATLCKVGVQGSGGGLIFFVDYNDEYPIYNYLEAAPADATFADGPDADTDPDKGGVWATTFPGCGVLQDTGCQTESIYSETGTALAALLGNGRVVFGGIDATARIVARHGSTAKNLYAAGVADDYVSPSFRGTTKSDWFLPSKGELNLVQAKLCEAGVGGFDSFYYWSSSENSGASA